MDEITLYDINDPAYNDFSVGNKYFLIDDFGNGYLGDYRGKHFMVRETTPRDSRFIVFNLTQGQYHSEQTSTVLKKFIPVNIHKTKY